MLIVVAPLTVSFAVFVIIIIVIIVPIQNFMVPTLSLVVIVISNRKI
jgi:hypothetical protein